MSLNNKKKKSDQFNNIIILNENRDEEDETSLLNDFWQNESNNTVSSQRKLKYKKGQNISNPLDPYNGGIQMSENSLPTKFGLLEQDR